VAIFAIHDHVSVSNDVCIENGRHEVIDVRKVLLHLEKSGE